MHQTLYIDVDEEVNSIISRIRKSLAKYNILVITHGALIVQSAVSLKLIKKEADSLGKKIMIVTKDELAASIAKKIGFAVRTSLDDLKELNAGEDVSPDKINSQALGGEKLSIRNSVSVVDTNRALNKNNRLGNLGSDSFVSLDKRMNTDIRSGVVNGKVENESIIEATEVEKVVNVINDTKTDFSIDEDESFRHLFSDAPRKEDINISADKNRNSGGGIFWVIFFALLILFFGVVAYFYLPKAEVVIFPKQEEQIFNLKMDVAEIPSVDSGDLINLKAQIIEDENVLSLSFPATGQKNSSSQKAKGKITIYNEFSETSQVLVSTTRLLSNEDKLFRLINTVTVPGMVIKDGVVEPGTAEAEIIADEAGESFNIKEADFKIPGFKGSAKYDKFYAKLAQETKGGGGGEGELKTVSGIDIEGAKIKTENELKNKLKEDIKNKLGNDNILLDDAISFEVMDYSVFPEEDSVTENFEYQVKIKIKALAFSNKELEQKISTVISNKLVQNNISLDIIKIDKEFSGANIDFSKKTIKTELKLKVNAKAKVDENKVANFLLGKNKSEISDIIDTFPEINKVEASISPSFISNNFPKYPSRINIRIEELNN